ncbi:adenosylcobalamin-dependent ribonucleoside-diphosphate reductase [Psychromarinibacter sp. C21-152]|uniref:Vitamin B12-dependent ribonucleotide reductase n=1 Tax=Psychromarinibacter sediminicola TaxID=3033385 RepID=A0AAE3TAD0_9RHOB|nr:adenosylcobalamin-dependent ribonucleoside-diphosphate reductase [Psychromarinibacter sediminicola]MDF0603142.1 adenosylcobalamin-dependent ribonucleoside-diphosphate reductase [Psychromarinibacter sediminicola]
MTRFTAPIAEQIWDMKYRLKEADGTPVDQTVEDSWRRIARAVASVEAEPDAWVDRFYGALEDFRFLPAGRITAGAGTDRAVTLFNCFVMGTIPDTMAGIFDALKEAALTMQQGGGIGYDFSTIRPKGADVKGVAADASGPLSFMDVWDAMCRTIMSAGSRRGAMMATMRCDHPDIEDFITAKKDAARLRNFNVSVLVTDAFMEAVKADGSWDLKFGDKVYHTVEARDLWNRIMRSTYDYAEPGVIFIDRINQMNNLSYCETIAATNPCGEQPLPPYGACLLGSINLSRLVTDPFGGGAAVDEDALDELVRVAVRMMDNVVDASKFPLPQQAEEARNKRRIGLGVTGLADALLMVGERYGSDAAAALTERWLHRVARAAYLASADLAAEKGAFPLYNTEKFLASGSLAHMDPDVREAIRKKGIRNALLTSIAPTGTISLYAGNVSSGIEPVFAYAYTRKVLQKDGTKTEEEVVDYALQMWRERFGEAELPDHFVNAQMLQPLEHVRMQAAAQKWVDSSISKTINCPEDIGFEAFKDVYMEAYETGCKGCTTYRPNEVTGSVLTVSEDGASRQVESFGEAFARHLAQSEKTVSEVANATGLSYHLLDKLKKRPNATTAAENAMKIAEFFGKSLSEFVEKSTPEVVSLTGAEPQQPHGDVVYISEPLDRPQQLEGQTYKLKWPDSEHAIYVTINDIILNGHRRPFEIFINSKNMEHFAWTVALTRMISAVFRRGGDVSFVVEELKAVFDPRGGAWMQGKYIPSILAAIGGVIERHLIAIGFIEGEGLGLKSDPRAEVVNLNRGRGPSCSSCGSYDLRMVEGCLTCMSCGYSKCG